MTNQQHKEQMETELIGNLISDLQHIFNTVSKDKLSELKKTIHLVFGNKEELSFDDTVIDSVRQIILAKEFQCKTLGQYRAWMKNSGQSIEHWPEFAKNNHDGEHLTKAGQGMIMIACIDHARKQLKA